MKENFDFEKIADYYSKKLNDRNSRMSKVSRCDVLVMKRDKDGKINEILFIEKTDFNKKDLLNFDTYSKEIIENVKKMWGSLAIFNLYVVENKFLPSVAGKDRIYILLLDKKFKDKRFSRIISNMIKALNKYRDSSYSHVKYKFKS